MRSDNRKVAGMPRVTAPYCMPDTVITLRPNTLTENLVNACCPFYSSCRLMIVHAPLTTPDCLAFHSLRAQGINISLNVGQWTELPLG